eukprot:jgi/Botrbrau1/8188/Bobra.357_2s0031.1
MNEPLGSEVNISSPCFDAVSLTASHSSFVSARVMDGTRHLRRGFSIARLMAFQSAGAHMLVLPFALCAMSCIECRFHRFHVYTAL